MRKSARQPLNRVLLQLLLLVTVPLLLTSCYSHVRNTGFLPGGYEEFNAIEEGFLKLRFEESSRYTPALTHDRKLRKVDSKTGDVIEQPLLGDDDTTRALAFILPETKWIAKDPYKGENAGKKDEILFTVRERLYRYLLRNYPHPVRVRYAFAPSDGKLRGYRVITFTSNVTNFTKGNGFMRYVFGWGAGEARIQIEGEIFEGLGDEQIKIGEYAIRRGSGGFAQNGLNTKVLKSDYCLKYAADEAIAILTEQLPYLMQGVETTKIGRINAAAVYRDLLDNTQYGTALEQAKSFLIPLDDTRRPILKKTFVNSTVVFSQQPGFGR